MKGKNELDILSTFSVFILGDRGRKLKPSRNQVLAHASDAFYKFCPFLDESLLFGILSLRSQMLLMIAKLRHVFYDMLM